MKRNLFFFLLFLVIVTSCSSSRITSSWKEPVSTPVNYKKVLVIALSQPDNTLKEQMEKHLVGDLESHGIQAISAYGNPALGIDNIPPETKSLAIIADDPDAPIGTWVHWVVIAFGELVGLYKRK